MKQRICLLILVIYLCFPLVTKAIATNSSDINYLKIYYFTKDDCEDCQKGKDILANYEDKEKINIEYLDINENKEIYNKVKDVLKIKKDYNPLIIIGSNYFYEFNDKTKDKLADAIKAYTDKDNFCNLVTLIKNDEKLDNCLKQNDGIYKQENNSILKVIGVICIGGLVIALGVFVFKKMKTSK